MTIAEKEVLNKIACFIKLQQKQLGIKALTKKIVKGKGFERTIWEWMLWQGRILMIEDIVKNKHLKAIKIFKEAK